MRPFATARPAPRSIFTTFALCLIAMVAMPRANVKAASEPGLGIPSVVTVAKQADGTFQYLVDGQPQPFVGMGYDPIYRNLSEDDRAANYQRDFSLLQASGVNTITGWDSDKGYDQDKFDEITLATADDYDIGVVMPLYLPSEGDYEDPAFVDDLMAQARAKIARFKDFHALRMWGVGNEDFWDMAADMHPAFLNAYLRIADLFHQMDPNHPVIYREAEDEYVPEIADTLRESGDMRPWLLYGMNIYNKDPGPLLDRWPTYGLDRPLIVSEFGTQGDTPDQRAQGYAAMWHSIRCRSDFVLGGAPYVWTTQGPEPTDTIWGLMDGDSLPVDGTFAALSQAWLTEPLNGAANCQGPAQPVFVPPSQPVPQPKPAAPAPVVRAPVVVAPPAPARVAPPPPPPSPAPAPSKAPPAAQSKPQASPTPSPAPRRQTTSPGSHHHH